MWKTYETASGTRESVVRPVLDLENNSKWRGEMMPLNKPSGNMYENIWTWSPFGGECPHKCVYCYVLNKIGPWQKRLGNTKYCGEVRLIERELKTKLVTPNDEPIFVQSLGDMFAEEVASKDIERVLEHCNKFPTTRFLFQSKNPGRFSDFIGDFPGRSILGTTIETNREGDEYCVSEGPSPWERYSSLNAIEQRCKMVSIEPIMKFDFEILSAWLWDIPGLAYVSIGADSGKNDLPEPTPEEIHELIQDLQRFVEVRLKKNLLELYDPKEFEEGLLAWC